MSKRSEALVVPVFLPHPGICMKLVTCRLPSKYAGDGTNGWPFYDDQVWPIVHCLTKVSLLVIFLCSTIHFAGTAPTSPTGPKKWSFGMTEARDGFFENPVDPMKGSCLPWMLDDDILMIQDLGFSSEASGYFQINFTEHDMQEAK